MLRMPPPLRGRNYYLPFLRQHDAWTQPVHDLARIEGADIAVRFRPLADDDLRHRFVAVDRADVEIAIPAKGIVIEGIPGAPAVARAIPAPIGTPATPGPAAPARRRKAAIDIGLGARLGVARDQHEMVE